MRTRRQETESSDKAMSSLQLAEWVKEARQRSCELVEDLTDDQLLGPRLSIINPLLWEIGHVAWFQEKWVLRNSYGLPPIRLDVDELYDSAAIPHDIRWDLRLPSRQQTLDYMQEVHDRIICWIENRPPNEEEAYF